MPEQQQTLTGPACEHEGCASFARRGHSTCRWHDPEVLRLREEAENVRQAALRAAGAA